MKEKLKKIIPTTLAEESAHGGSQHMLGIAGQVFLIPAADCLASDLIRFSGIDNNTILQNNLENFQI